MPTMTVRTAAQVPQPSRVSRAVREQQELYEGFIKQIGENVGELEPAPGEQIRALKVRLRRASTRLGIQIDIWDAKEHVYFAIKTARRRGRPRKNP
jgi:hypothetical protein